MLKLIDTDDNWCWLDPESLRLEVVCEDGSCRLLSTNDLIFDRGKHKGMVLGEFEQIGYLQWLADGATINEFEQKLIKRRLRELQA